MSTLNTNGRQRKTLASQIDRLDAMLDGLADGLNDAVGQAVHGAVALAVQEAVRAVLTEVLTNPAVLAKLRAETQAAQGPPPAGEPAPAAPVGRFASCRGWVGTRLKKLGERCRGGWKRVREAGAVLTRRVTHAFRAARAWAWEKAARAACGCRLLWLFGLHLGAAFGIGWALRVVAFVAGVIPPLVLHDWYGLIVAVVARALLWLRRLLTTFPSWAVEGLAYQEA